MSSFTNNNELVTIMILYRIPGNLYFTLFLRIGEIKNFTKYIFANPEFEAMAMHNISTIRLHMHVHVVHTVMK